jgi:hypothetical protein
MLDSRPLTRFYASSRNYACGSLPFGHPPPSWPNLTVLEIPGCHAASLPVIFGSRHIADLGGSLFSILGFARPSIISNARATVFASYILDAQHRYRLAHAESPCCFDQLPKPVRVF